MRFLLALLAIAALAAPAHAAQTRAFVFQTDYITGSLSVHDLAPRSAHCDVASVNSDASLRWYDGLLYVVNRFGADNIQVVDPATYATLRQFTVGNGANPHDIAFASPTRAYVTRFDTNDLWVVNPATGAHTGTVSLAGFADADGSPEMDRMIMVGPLLFVSLERIDRNNGYGPADTALVAVVDTRADTLVDCDPGRPGVQAIALKLRNPFTTFQFDPATSRLLIGCVGAFGVQDGGIERVDPVNLASEGVAITEAALGGDVNDVVWGGAAKSWAIVADAAGNTKFVSWSAATGAALATLWNPGGYVLTDAERNDRGELWVCNGSFSTPAVRVFSAATDAVVGGDVVCALPPAAMTFDVASGQVAAVPPAAEPALYFAPVAPNPARGPVRLVFELARGAQVRLELFDAQGRRVRTLADGAWAAGAASITWDLADEAGHRVAPGLFLARLRVGGEGATRHVIVVR